MSLSEITCEMGNSQITEIVHKSVTIPNLSILFTLYSIFFLIVGLIMVHSKSKGKPVKFIWVWVVGVLVGGIALAFMIASPNAINNLWEGIRKIWN